MSHWENNLATRLVEKHPGTGKEFWINSLTCRPSGQICIDWSTTRIRTWEILGADTGYLSPNAWDARLLFQSGTGPVFEKEPNKTSLKMLETCWNHREWIASGSTDWITAAKRQGTGVVNWILTAKKAAVMCFNHEIPGISGDGHKKYAKYIKVWHT